MRYEIINPSDPYTFDAPSHETATLAILIMGEGQLAAEPLDAHSPEEVVPLLLFGTVKEYCLKRFGVEPNELLKRALDDPARREGLADALDSVLIGRPEDRAAFETKHPTPGARRAARIEYHDRKRSSMNDIARYAWQVAQTIRNGPVRTAP